MVMGAEVDWDMCDEDRDTYGDNGYDEPQVQLAICDGDAEEDLDEDDELYEPHLCAQFQQAQRSLTQARDAIKRARISRGFQPKAKNFNRFNKFPPKPYGQPRPNFGNSSRFGNSSSSNVSRTFQPLRNHVPSNTASAPYW